MTTSSGGVPKVLISYAHESPEHIDRVLSLADRLLAGGVDCHLDQYETSPPEGWPRWASRQIEEADYVLIVCTEVYQRRFKGTEEAGKGLGAQWEGAIITQELYGAAGNNTKFIPVLLSPEDSKNIPHVLRGVRAYDLSAEEGYTELYRRLTNQPFVTKPDLGTIVPLPTRERKQFFLTSSWNIPYAPNPFFTGRENALAQLHDALTTKGTAAVSGMPGVGKTQTAVEYAHRHRSEYKLILWARAETRETLISDYVNIAATLQLPEVRAPEQNLAVGAVRRWLDANPDWLLVLDNADDLALVRDFLPATPKGRVIITTRAQATGAIAPTVEVLKMGEEEGALFLLRRAKILAEEATLESATEEDRAKAREITTEVDGLPLALDQAGAFIEESSSSPTEYLELYRTQGAYLRSQRGELAADHPESVAITFSLSFDKVAAASPTAADLLRACAFLAPNFIPEEIFTGGGTQLGDLLVATTNNPLALINAIRETGRYSLLRRDVTKHTLSVHRIVQDVIIDTMSESVRPLWAERIIKAVNQVLPDFDEKNISEWYRFERLLPHAHICAKLIARENFQFSEAAQLLNNAARYMHNRARLIEVEPLYIHSLAIREDLYGPDHPDVATSLYNMGWLKYDQGEYDESEPLYLRALDIRRNRFGPDALVVVECMDALGWLKHFQGKVAESKKYFSQSITGLEKIGALDSSLLANSMLGLANVLKTQGRYAEAESLLERSLKIREKIYGIDHYEIAIILKGQGDLYQRQGLKAQAEALYLRSRYILEKTYGADHPLLASTLNSLAQLYHKQNKLPEAEKLFLQSIEIDKKVLGRDHPRNITKLNNLAMFYRAQGDFAKAEELCQYAYDIAEKRLGTEHPDKVMTIVTLAVINMELQRYTIAEQLFKTVITIRKKTLQPEHPALLYTLSNYAELLKRMNRKGEAQKLAAYVKKMRAKQGGKKGKG